MFLSFFFLLAPSATWASLPGENLSLPSSTIFQGGRDSENSRSALIGVNLSLPYNFQLLSRAERNTYEIEEETFFLNKFTVGIGSDPLDEISVALNLSSTTNGSETEENEVSFDLVWAPLDWLIIVKPSKRKLTTQNRPTILNQSDTLEINSSSLRLTIERFMGRHWSARIFGSSYQYDEDLSYYARPITENLIPYSSQTVIFAYPKSDYGGGVGYSHKTFSVGIQVSSMKMKLDGARTESADISGSYRISRSWSLIGSVGRSESMASTDSGTPVTTASLGGIYTWGR